MPDGFRMDDIKYRWGDGLKNASHALDISPNIELPQLKYKDNRLIERQFRLSTGNILITQHQNYLQLFTKTPIDERPLFPSDNEALFCS